MKPQIKSALKSYASELIVYTGLVAAYYFLVLHFMGDWLYGLFVEDHRLYSGVAIGLIIAQGFLLEVLTRWLLSLFKFRAE
jgi:hypothetical protein